MHGMALKESKHLGSPSLPQFGEKGGNEINVTAESLFITLGYFKTHPASTARFMSI